MLRRTALSLCLPLAAAGLAHSSAAPAPEPRKAPALELVSPVRESTHREGDDLLSAGLGIAGLRSPQPPVFSDPDHPTAAELRRRAIWSNWRGIADLSLGGAVDLALPQWPRVPGREFQAFARLPGASQPHRVLLQLPDDFDRERRCVVVAPASGSRGVYGAIALAGPWALPRGCAVAYTDKGAGSGWYDLAAGEGAGLDGRLASGDAQLDFRAIPGDERPLVAVKHAHSGDHPEADWGRHTEQAARFALEVLNANRREGEAEYSAANTRILAFAVSNGAAAVLRAAELDGSVIAGVVAVSPNVLPGEGGRSLYDYGTEAGLLMPCALADGYFDAVPWARAGGVVPPFAALRCASLKAAGLIEADTPATQAAEALARLRGVGWSEAALAAGALSVGLDLWRAVGATYASAYLRRPAHDMPCGYHFAMPGEDGQPRPPSRAERAAWWSDSAGVPPGAGVLLRDGPGEGPDAAFASQLCARALVEAATAAPELQTAIGATRAGLPREGLPVILLHGLDDGLVPEAFSSGAYAAWTAQHDRSISYWQLAHVQHFDSALALPPFATRYLPLQPYAWAAMDALWAHLDEGQPLPPSRRIEPALRAPIQAGFAPLTWDQLGLVSR